MPRPWGKVKTIFFQKCRERIIISDFFFPQGRMALHLLPACPHQLEMGKGRVAERCHVDVDAEKGEERAGQDVVGTDEKLYTSHRDDPFPERRDVHQQNTAHDYQGQQHKHDYQVAEFLDCVKLIFHRSSMGILPAEEIAEEIKECLSEYPSFQIIQIGNV